MIQIELDNEKKKKSVLFFQDQLLSRSLYQHNWVEQITGMREQEQAIRKSSL